MSSMSSLRAESPRLITVDDPKMRIFFAGIVIMTGLVIAYLATLEDIIFSTRVAIVIGYVVGVPLLFSANYDRSIMLMFAFGSVAGVLKYKTDFNPIIHVTIDIMMVLICLGWLVRHMFATRTSPPVSTPCGRLIGIFVFLCVIQIFNPFGYSYFASIASLKMHIFMIPLFFFGYHYFRSVNQFRNWCVAWVIIGLVMSFYTITQFQKGPEAMKAEMPEYAYMIEANTWQDDTGKSFFRPMSTTANPGGASTWMQCIVPLTLAVLMFKRISRRMRLFLFCSLMVLFGTLFISLIRQMLMVTLAGLAMIFFIQFVSGRLGRGLSGLFVALLIGFLGWQLATGVAGGAMRENLAVMLNPFEAFQENRGHSYSYMDLMIKGYPLGAGLGRTGPASAKFMEELNTYRQQHGGPGMMPGENYFLLMIAETGIPGTAMICIIAIMFLWRGFQGYRSIQDNDLKWAAAASLAVLTSIFAVFFGGPALVQPPLNLFFWFLGGALLKMPVLDRELRQTATPAPPEPSRMLKTRPHLSK